MMMKLIIIAVSMINQNKKIIESYFFLFYLNKENLKFLIISLLLNLLISTKNDNFNFLLKNKENIY